MAHLRLSGTLFLGVAGLALTVGSIVAQEGSFRLTLDEARRVGARRLRILSDPHAQAFYRRMGARMVGRVDGSIGGVERWLPTMELVIEGGPGPESSD